MVIVLDAPSNIDYLNIDSEVYGLLHPFTALCSKNQNTSNNIIIHFFKFYIYM